MIIEKGYAKINLGLEVVRKREDGYHDLSMIMTSINLYDELYFEELKTDKIIIDCEKLSHVKLEDNLVYKSIMLIKDKFNIKKGIKVKITKRIPERAGLAGGSADAAATLRALNVLWGLNLTLDELAEIGFSIGSDIPFCVYNKTAKVSGRGEKLEFIDDVPFAYVLLVFPFFNASTANVFKQFKVHKNNEGKIELLTKSINEGNIIKMSSYLFNDLENGVDQEIENIKKDLLSSGVIGCAMTGSGSTVFGICLSEKHVKNVETKFSNLSVKKYGNNKNGRITLITSLRSNRKANNVQGKSEVNGDIKVIDFVETKAYGMIALGYQRCWKNFKQIFAPISSSDNIVIYKLNEKVVELFYDDNRVKDDLEQLLKILINNLHYGLRVKIKRRIDSKLNIFNNYNYLSAVISSLSSFGEDVDKLYKTYPKSVELYKNYHTTYYDSKLDQYDIIDDAVFGYVLIVPFNIDNYKSPKYTTQIRTDSQELEKIIEGLKDKNFYKMASNAFNGVERFEIRRINEYKGKGYYEKVVKICKENGASGVVLSLDGKSLICLCRYNKTALKIDGILKERFRLKNILLTSIKSNVIHKTSTSVILQDAVEDKVNDFIFDFDEHSFDESSPFDNGNIDNIDDFNYYDSPHKFKRRKRRELTLIKESPDYEGLLSLHSGGSIFKQYDFVDIAKYFNKFFNGKRLNFKIDDKDIDIRFYNSRLPHILGIHLLDESDLSLRGQSGFEKLINGEISYKELKRQGKINLNTLRSIAKKTESSVMIFNDIFNNNLYNISCFERKVIVSDNTKMDKLEYGITRRLTDESFHVQNLLGIGRDSKTNEYFIYTSFLWKVPGNVGKKDSCKIGISR